jgi:enamine deaminase RidA (YjgF/YER057c/UK114 family)
MYLIRMLNKSGVISRHVHIEARLKELGITLPTFPIPKGNYINFVQTGNLVYIAGSLPQPIGAPLITGRLGENMTIEEGQNAARHAGLNMLASLQMACDGNLDKVKRIVKINGYVSSTNDFTAQATVMNGCSDLFGDVFLEKGRHARAAVASST